MTSSRVYRITLLSKQRVIKLTTLSLDFTGPIAINFEEVGKTYYYSLD